MAVSLVDPRLTVGFLLNQAPSSPSPPWVSYRSIPLATPSSFRRQLHPTLACHVGGLGASAPISAGEARGDDQRGRKRKTDQAEGSCVRKARRLHDGWLPFATDELTSPHTRRSRVEAEAHEHAVGSIPATGCAGITHQPAPQGGFDVVKSFISQHFRVCDGKVVNYTRNREYLFSRMY